MERIVSGIKPTGRLTLGNYLGALRRFKDLQKEGETVLFIADLHALTLPIEPDVLRRNSLSVAAAYLAAGLDPKKTIIFLQSQVSQHSELAIILQNYFYLGELRRMTQFKDKARKADREAVGLGLFVYPALMAADILLYDAAKVPVGEDQRQHVELARDVARRFNNRYGKTFVIPEAILPARAARVMSLSDPSRKMSKSDPKGDVFLDEDLGSIRKKIMSAVTDLGHEVRYDPADKPGISNLMNIYGALSGKSCEEIERQFKGSGYGDFKKAVADLVIEELAPFQERYRALLAGGKLASILEDGALRASRIAAATLRRVKEKVGLLGE